MDTSPEQQEAIATAATTTGRCSPRKGPSGGGFEGSAGGGVGARAGAADKSTAEEDVGPVTEKQAYLK